MPPRIHTLTGNLLWEQTLVFGAWGPGRTQRAAAATFQVGGKGINVSKMLNRLGTPNTALCFTGGFTGAACRGWLRERRLAFRAFPASAPTRIATVVRGGARGETTFFSPDTPPGRAAVRACSAYLNARPDGGVLAVSGSLPGWDGAAFDPLRAALDRWARRGILVVDTYGPPLAWFARRPVALIKVNRTEFAGLAGSAAGSAALRRARARWAARSWVVTGGARPVALIDEAGRSAQLTPPPVREVSPTGSGDVLLACVLHAQLRLGLALREAVAFALPYAAANAAHGGIAEFPEVGRFHLRRK